MMRLVFFNKQIQNRIQRDFLEKSNLPKINYLKIFYLKIKFIILIMELFFFRTQLV